MSGMIHGATSGLSGSKIQTEAGSAEPARRGTGHGYLAVSEVEAATPHDVLDALGKAIGGGHRRDHYAGQMRGIDRHGVAGTGDGDHSGNCDGQPEIGFDFAFD